MLMGGASKGLIADEGEGSPDSILFLGAGFNSFADNAMAFEAVDGGLHRVCRGMHENDGTLHGEMWASYFGTSSYDVEHTDTRGECEELCQQREACTGYEYKYQSNYLGLVGAGRCELWNRIIETSVSKDEFYCYRRTR